MRVLAVIPSSSQTDTKREYILGIPYLVASLKKNGYHNIKVFNFFHNPWSETEKLTINAIEDFKPDVILISCFTINRIAGYKTAILCKEYAPLIKVVMGGMHPSFLYDQILSNFPIDAVCIGESDHTIVELLDAFRTRDSLDKVKGIAYSKNGNVLLTKKRPFIKNLDSLPFPVHEIYREDILKTGKAHVISSRGCPFGCQFCSTTQFWGKTWRSRSSKNVIDEIELLVKDYGINFLNFMDDEFTLNRRRTFDICKEIIDRGIKVKWSCSTRVDTIDEEQLEWMIKSGCQHIALGIESGSPRMLKTIGKKITVEHIERAFNLIQQYGLSRGAYVMVGNPGENKESVKETIKLVKRLKLDISSVAVAEVYPGTVLHELSKSNGFMTDDYWLSEASPPFYTMEHSAEKLQLWAFLIVLNSKIAQGPIKTIQYIAKFISSKRKKIIKYIFRVFKNLIRIGKKTHQYKEY